MRVGPEQFIIKDFAFYDAMITPALGLHAVTVYEVLRRHIWRSAERGSRRAKGAFKDGRLSSTISRKKIATLTGISVRSVQTALNKLREVGWVRGESGNGTGETVVYELGFRDPHSTERFYADDSLRTLWLGLEDLAEQGELARVSDLSCEERLSFAEYWFAPAVAPEGVVQEVHTPGAGGAPVPQGGGAGGAPRIENPTGSGIEKAEEYTGREAPADTAGPGPKHWDRPPGPEQRRRRPSKKKKQETSGASLLLTDEGDAGQDDGDRFARAAQVAGAAKGKADTQVDKNAKKRARKAGVDPAALAKRLEESRTDQVVKGDQNAQKARNLKGGTKYTHATLKASRNAWDLYSNLVKERDASLPVVRWNADGNAKARGQMCRIVDMYGGDATRQAIRYVVGNWDSINERIFKKGPGSVPNFGLLLSMHETLFREAALWGQHREVLEEWNGWFAENPMKPAPSDLKERYEVAQQALSAIGLGC